MRFRIVTLALLGLLLGCGTLPFARPESSAAPSVWTGFLEGQTAQVSPQAGGRLVHIAVQEGDVVRKDQELYALDAQVVQARIKAADANIAVAEAQVNLLEAGARPEDLARAGARVEQARAALDAADAAVSDAQAIRDNPQALALFKAQAETRAATAALAFEAALAQAGAADVESSFWQDQVRNLWDGVDVTLPNGTTRHFNTPSARVSYAQDQWNAASQRAWLAWAAVDAARANDSAADTALRDAQDQLGNPLAIDARVDAGKSARDRAAANLQSAQAALQLLRDGASPAQIQTARAAVDQARSARASLDRDLANLSVHAPRDGTVKRVYYRKGEVVGPGSPVIQLAIGGELTLRVFVPMSELAQVRMGQTVTAWLPEGGGVTANATVTRIADQAEFTGRQPQTDNERNAQLVAVELTLQSAGPEIKAGMPASVSFPAAGASQTTVLASAAGSDAVTLTFSGELAERQTRLAAQVEAAIVSIAAARGDTVHAGDVVVALDRGKLDDAQNEAEAAVRTAQANLDQARETARAGTLAMADASVALAQAELDAAKRSADDANRALSSPQELAEQLHAAEGRVQAAQAEQGRAEAMVSDLERQVEVARNDLSQSGKARLAILEKQVQAADFNRRAAEESIKGSQRVLDLTRALYQNPLELAAAAHAAASGVQVAEAGLKVAETELAIAKRDAQPEAVALARARLQATQASLEVVKAQGANYEVASPVTGRVVAREAQPGETAQPGIPLLVVAETEQLEVTVYVPVRELGHVQLGRQARVKLPSLPDKNYLARVSYISPEAEFKPANIYNAQDRSEIVMAVRVTLENGDGDLKAGLPADITLE